MKISRRRFALLPAIGLWPNRMSSTKAPERSQTRILFGGDVMLSRYVGALALEKDDPAWPMRELAALFSSADLAFVNLESPFSDRGPSREHGMVFKAEPRMIEALVTAGIDVVSTANNHARDGGGYGIEYTLARLAEKRIASIGTGATAAIAHQGAVLVRNNVGFGFLAYTYDQSNGNHADWDDRIAMMNVDQMVADIQRLRQRTDVVIVSMHAGNEYGRKPNAHQRKFAHAAIDAGASIVAGHHPHVTQPVEAYGDGVIFYSLGNLVFDQFQRKETQRGWIADVRFTAGRLSGYGVIPVDIVGTVPRLRTPGPQFFVSS